MSEKTEKKSDTNSTKDSTTTEELKLPAEELSEEDLQLKEELLLLVERLEDEEVELRQNSLNILRGQIRSSTSSMTSVPKPLKFLRPHFQQIVSIYDKYPEGETKKELADVLSVLGMTIGEKRDCLKYRLQGTSDAVSTWGHEYIRHLSGEIQAEYQEKIKGGDDEMQLDADYIIELVKEIVPFNMQHNAECEACDLLMEVERLDTLEDYVDELAHERVCLYLVSCVQYVAEPENTTLLTVAISIFRKFNKLAAAMRLAMQLNDLKLIKDIFFSCNDELLKKQLCFMLGRQQVFLEIPVDELEISNELLQEIISNSQLNQHFLALARELDIVEPKLPDDVMKNHSDHPRIATQDQNKMFLASTFVNGFVNCAFGKDKVTMDADNQAWFGKAKDNGMISAVASLGLIMLWDVDTGLTHIDKYLYSQDIEIKAGALLATGIVNCGIRNECDPAMGILSEFVSDANVSHVKMKIAAVLGLGLAYAGSCREDLIEMLSEVFTDRVANANDKLITSEVISVTALSIGLIALGSCNAELAIKLLTIFSKEGYNMKSTFNRFIILAVGLIFLGKQKAANDIANAFDDLPAHLKDFAVILVDVCAYAGTGNVLKIQSLLHKASEFFSEEEEKEKDTKGKENLKDPTAVAGALHEPGAHQAITVLGIALVAMGEDIGAEMSLRTFSHLLQYGDSVIRRSVPLALALLSASNPQLPVLDTLSKLSHDNDAETAHNAILAMGIVGAGTNNSRLVNMLKQLATYYQKDSNNLYIVRIAQGLIHLGKGTLTLNPYHSDRGLFTPVAVGSLVTVLVAAMDIKNILIGHSNPCYLLYCIALAIQPRMLVTLDSDLKPLSVSVRVGQAVDVVGQAGKPKTITGFQTHSTPVLLSYGERAELATNEYIPTTPLLEGFVILQKNKDLTD